MQRAFVLASIAFGHRAFATTHAKGKLNIPFLLAQYRRPRKAGIVFGSNSHRPRSQYAIFAPHLKLACV
eukprot:6014539-Amphidinium_carterae.1